MTDERREAEKTVDTRAESPRLQERLVVLQSTAEPSHVRTHFGAYEDSMYAGGAFQTIFPVK